MTEVIVTFEGPRDDTGSAPEIGVKLVAGALPRVDEHVDVQHGGLLISGRVRIVLHDIDNGRHRVVVRVR